MLLGEAGEEAEGGSYFNSFGFFFTVSRESFWRSEIWSGVIFLVRGTTNRTERKTQAEVVQPDYHRPA